MLKMNWVKPKLINLSLKDTREDTFSQFDGLEVCPFCGGAWVWDSAVSEETGTISTSGHFNHIKGCNSRPSTTTSTIIAEPVCHS